jgi:hypothetical protein
VEELSLSPPTPFLDGKRGYESLSRLDYTTIGQLCDKAKLDCSHLNASQEVPDGKDHGAGQRHLYETGGERSRGEEPPPEPRNTHELC